MFHISNDFNPGIMKTDRCAQVQEYFFIVCLQDTHMIAA